MWASRVQWEKAEVRGSGEEAERSKGKRKPTGKGGERGEREGGSVEVGPKIERARGTEVVVGTMK